MAQRLQTRETEAGIGVATRTCDGGAQLELGHDPLAQASDRDLLRDATDAAALLALGPDGIHPRTAAQLRTELVASVNELSRRWSHE